MGTAAEIGPIVWLKAGGRVVAASERAARALRNAYDRAHRVEGLAAWPAANILDWQSFVRNAWAEFGYDGRMMLSSFQEQSLWAEIVDAKGQGNALLEGPRRHLAALAMDAHRLLCAYAPAFLSKRARAAWQQDAAAFSGWLSSFDHVCASDQLISEARLPIELLQLLQSTAAKRPPLLLAGFDRILPIQRGVFDAGGEWREAAPAERANRIHFHQAVDPSAELAACACWCRQQLDANPRAHLVVVTQDVSRRRGEIERAFLRHVGNPHSSPLFELSLGVSLRQIALPRGAYLLLRWLSGPLEEHEIDWLFSTGQSAADAAEAGALAGFMRALRQRGMERALWRVEEFIRQRPGTSLPDPWGARIIRAKRQLDDARRSAQSSLAWSELVPRLLEMAGWPGTRSLTSAEFQALRRWQHALDACASLGFNGRRIDWTEFLSDLSRALDETLFAPESHDAPIQIAGPAESAGLEADAVWMMGVSEDVWPPGGSTNPLLPFDLQRDANMPHALPQLDWDLAQVMTARLAASAAEVHFSYAKQSGGVAARASRLIVPVAGPPQPVSTEFASPAVTSLLTERFEDSSYVPLRSAHALGGSTILTSQSQCPFKAFATARLNAQGWQPAQAGLTASQRGQLLHAVLNSLWAGKPEGIRTHEDLVAISDLAAFIEGHVRKALGHPIVIAATGFMPRRYLELERMRLVRLVTEWLQFERSRAPFSVAHTELDTDASVAGLNLRVRIDRIDRLSDGSLLVIDYKTGNVSPALWGMPRPDDLQVPLYAGFALTAELRGTIAHEADEEETQNDEAGSIGGLVFARVRVGEASFAGRVGNAQATLSPALNRLNALVRKPLDAAELMNWRDYIERMAQDFIAGCADVDPRSADTCKHCDLHSLCRIQQVDGCDEEVEDE